MTEALAANVGLLGPRRAGKTTFFAVLERALRDRDWTVGVESTDGNRRLLDEIRTALNAGYWPGKTLVRSRSDQFTLHLSRGPLSFTFSFFDPPGELFELTGEADTADAARARHDFFSHLVNCSGLMILFDLTRPAQTIIDSWRASIESYQAFIRETAPAAAPNGRLQARVAVVLTKADLLPWIRRHRQRDAGAWLEAHPALGELYHDARRSSVDTRFFFSSAVGWDGGAPGCRTTVVPRRLEFTGPGAPARDRDLIPDPPDRTEGDAITTKPPMLPLFTDPLQLVDDRSLAPRYAEEAGVIMLPGRHVGRADDRRLLTPWNIVEPLIWAAGLEGNR